MFTIKDVDLKKFVRMILSILLIKAMEAVKSILSYNLTK